MNNELQQPFDPIFEHSLRLFQHLEISNYKKTSISFYFYLFHDEHFYLHRVIQVLRRCQLKHPMVHQPGKGLITKFIINMQDIHDWCSDKSRNYVWYEFLENGKGKWHMWNKNCYAISFSQGLFLPSTSLRALLWYFFKKKRKSIIPFFST